MAVTRGTLQIMRGLRRDIGTEVDAAVRTLTSEWVDAWDGLARQWRAAADVLVSAAVGLGRWPYPGEVLRVADVDAAMRATIAALDKLADRTETVTRDGADRIVQLDTEREPRIIASQAPAAEEPALAQRVATMAVVEALRKTGGLREDARADVQLIAASRIRTNAIDVITARTGEQITTTVLPLSPAATDAMRRELIRGIDVGNNPRTAAARMVSTVQGQFNGGLTRAMTIARTEMVDAYRATSQQIHSANGDIVPGWQWLATFDRRVCPSCLAMHGTRHPSSEPGPIDHQQGRCARLPVLASWAELGIRAPEPPSATPDAQAWFANLPQAQRLQIMGPGRLQLLDDGAIGWGDLSTVRQTPDWRPSRVPVPLRDLRRRTGQGLAPTSAAPSPARPPSRPAPPLEPAAPTYDQRLAAATAVQPASDSLPIGLARRTVPAGARRLTKAERDDLDSYRGASYAAINGVLRQPGGLTAVADQRAYRPLLDRIGRIDRVMDRSVLPADVVVYRGVRDARVIFRDNWDRNLAGAEWTEDAYVSTSANESLSRLFGNQPGGALMRIVVPSGTRGVALSGMSGEAELLWQRGLRLRVVRDTGPGPGLRRLDVEVVAAPPAPAIPAAPVRRARPVRPPLPQSVRQAGRDLTTDITPATFRAVLERSLARGYGHGQLTELTRLQPGWNNPAQVVSAKRLDEAVERGWTQLWRGVTSARFAGQMRDGDWDMGTGIYGNGVYTSTRRTTAEMFRGAGLKDPDGDHWGLGDEWTGGLGVPPSARGGLVRMALDPSARLADYHALQAEFDTWRQQQINKPWVSEAMNFSWFAVTRGYDGVVVRARPGVNDGSIYPNGVQNVAEADQYIIFNRSVLMTEEASDRYDP